MENNDEPQLNGDIEVLKAGNFKTRVRWFHAEFSQNIEDATQTEQGLMYFWAAARTYFKAWMFTKIGKKKTCAELAKEARHYIALVWGNGEVAARVLEDMKQMANDMIMCHERLDGSEEESRFIEAFSTDDNPKDFRSAICRTMKEFETEKDEPEPTTSATYHFVEC